MSKIQAKVNNFKSGVNIFLILSLLILSCNRNPLVIDVSGVDLELEVIRFEQELFEADTTQMAVLDARWQTNLGFLYESFCADMIGEGMPGDSLLPSRLSVLVNHPDMREIYTAIQSEFSDFTPYQQELTEAFKHFRYYFPQSDVPKIVTFYSNFNASAFPIEGILGIGLDMYLGTDHELVKKIPTEYLPQFIKKKMRKEYLSSDAMKYFLFNKFYVETGDDLLSRMVDAGRMMYLLDAMMPEVAHYRKMGFTQEEWEWVEASEFNIWTVLIKQNYLYSKDFTVIQKFMDPAPFTALLPQESPGMTGVWVGYKMFKSYAEKSKLTVHQVATEKHDSRKVLQLYKPQK